MRDGLRERPSLRGKQNHALARWVPLLLRGNAQRFHALEDRPRLQYHPFAAAEWTVVNRAVTIVRERPQVMRPDFDRSVGNGAAQDAVIERPREEGWKDGGNLKTHKRAAHGAELLALRSN